MAERVSTKSTYTYADAYKKELKKQQKKNLSASKAEDAALASTADSFAKTPSLFYDGTNLAALNGAEISVPIYQAPVAQQTPLVGTPDWLSKVITPAQTPAPAQVQPQNTGSASRADILKAMEEAQARMAGISPETLALSGTTADQAIKAQKDAELAQRSEAAMQKAADTIAKMPAEDRAIYDQYVEAIKRSKLGYGAEAKATLESQLRAKGYNTDELQRYQDVVDSQAVAEQTRADAIARADKNGVISSFGSVPQNLVGSVESAVDFAGQGIERALSGSDIAVNTNSDLQQDRIASAAVREEVSENIRKHFDGTEQKSGLSAGNVASFAYQTAMSGLDSALAAYVPGGAALLGTGAGSQAVADALDKGVSYEDAVMNGVAAGLFEGLFESVSIAQLKSFKDLEALPEKTIRDFLKKSAASVFTNATEEGATQIADNLAEAFFLEDKSTMMETYNDSYQAYIEQGLTKEEAQKKATEDTVLWFLKDTGLAAAGGALMGAGFAALGSGTAARNIIANKNTQATQTAQGSAPVVPTQQETQAVETPQKTQENAVPERALKDNPYDAMSPEWLAHNVAEKLANGEKLSNAEMNTLYANKQKVADELGVDVSTFGTTKAEMREAIKDFKYQASETLQEAEETPAQQAELAPEVVEQTTENATEVAATENVKAEADNLNADIDAQYLTEEERADGIRISQRDGKVWTDGGEPIKLRKIDKRIEQRIKHIAKAVGREGKIVFRDDMLDGDVGAINLETGEVYINRWQDTANGANNAALYTLFHEFAHSGQDSEAWNGLYELIGSSKAGANFLTYKGGGVKVNLKMAEAIKKQEYKRMGIPLTDKQAQQELAAEFVEKCLFMEEEDIKALCKEKTSLAYKVKGIIDKVLSMLGNEDAAVRNDLRKAQKLFAKALNETEEREQNKQNKGLEYKMDTRTKAAVADIDLTGSEDGAGITYNDNGEVITMKDDNGTLMFNEATWTGGGKAVLQEKLNEMVENGQVSEEDAAGMIDEMEQWYQVSQEIRKGNPALVGYGQWALQEIQMDAHGDIALHCIVKNSEYTMNIDFSTVCKKRAALNQILNSMVKEGEFREWLRSNELANGELRPEDIADINEVIQEHGFEIACKMCFVDAKRFAIDSWAQSFVQPYNKLVAAYWNVDPSEITEMNFSGAKNRQLGNGMTIEDRKAAEKRVMDLLKTEEFADDYDPEKGFSKNAKNGKKTKPKGIWKRQANLICGYLTNGNAKVISEYNQDISDKAARLLNADDLISSAGMDGMKKDFPELYGVLKPHQGTAKPKTAHSETPYASEIILGNINDAKFNWEKAFAIGGVRIQSFSDFRANMWFDYMQAFTELSAKSCAAQSYTKEAAFAKLFGKTGAKINMSLLCRVNDADLKLLRSLSEKEMEQVKKGIGDPKAIAALRRVGLATDGGYEWAKETRKANGKVDLANETFDPEEAFFIQSQDEYGKNCGTIVVGLSYDHVMKMIMDPNIRMVIPYHKSGMNHLVAIKTNTDLFTDFTEYQSETMAKTGRKPSTKAEKAIKVDFYSILEKNTADAYLGLHVIGGTQQENLDAVIHKTEVDFVRECENKGLRPRFPQFAYIITDGSTEVKYAKNADGKYMPTNVEYGQDGLPLVREGYYKVLEDYTLKDNKGHYTGYKHEIAKSGTRTQDMIKKGQKMPTSTRYAAQDKVHMDLPSKVKCGTEINESILKKHNLTKDSVVDVKEYLSMILEDQQLTQDKLNADEQNMVHEILSRLTESAGRNKYDLGLGAIKSNASKRFAQNDLMHSVGRSERIDLTKSHNRNAASELAEIGRTSKQSAKQRENKKINAAYRMGVAETQAQADEKLAKAKADITERLTTKAEKEKAKAKAKLENAHEQIHAMKEDKSREQGRIDAAYRMGVAETQKKADEKLDRTKERFATQKENARKRELREKIDKKVKELTTMLTRPTETKHIPKGMISAVSDIVETLNLVTASASTIGNIGAGETSATKTTEKLQKLINEVERIKTDQNDTISYDFATSGIDELAKQLMFDLEDSGHIVREMNESELQQLEEIVSNIVSLIKNAGKAEVAGKTMEIAQINAQAAEEVKEAPGSGPNERTAMGKILGFGDAYMTEMSTPKYFFNKISGWKHGIIDKMREDANNGQRKMFELQMQAANMFKSLTESDKFKAFSGRKAKLEYVGVFNSETGEEVPLTHAQMCSLYMHLQNPDNSNHIVNGGLSVPDPVYYAQGNLDQAYAHSINCGIEDVDRMVHNLTEAMDEYDFEWIEQAREFFDDWTKKNINETSLKLVGYEKARVNHYFPIQSEKHELNRTFDEIVQRGGIESAGWLKDRKKGTNAINLLDINQVITKQAESVARYCGLAIPMRTWSRVYGKGGNTSFAKIVDDKFNTNATKYIEKWQADMQGAAAVNDGVFRKYIKAMTGNYAGAVLTMNPTSALSQVSLSSAASVLGHRATARAYADLANVALVGGRSRALDKINAEMAEHTPIGWVRKNSVKDMYGAGGTVVDRFLEAPGINKLTSWIARMDENTIAACWQGAKYSVQYDGELEKGSEEYWAEVAERFNRAVEETQPNYTPMQMTGFSRTKDSTVRALTVFKSPFMATANTFYDALGEARTAYHDSNATEQQKRDAYNHLGGVVAAQVLQAFISATLRVAAMGLVLHKLDDDRDETGELSWIATLENIFRRSVSNMVSQSFPVLFGDIFTAVQSGVTHTYYYGMSGDNGLESLSNMMTDLNKLLDGGATGKEIANAASDICIAVGLPSTAVKNWYKSFTAYAADIKAGQFGGGYETTTKNMNAAINKAATNSKYSLADAQKIVDKYIKSHPEKEKSDVRSAITNANKPKYLAASESEKKELAKILTGIKFDGVQIYEQKDLDKWVADAEKKSKG